MSSVKSHSRACPKKHRGQVWLVLSAVPEVLVVLVAVGFCLLVVSLSLWMFAAPLIVAPLIVLFFGVRTQTRIASRLAGD